MRNWEIRYRLQPIGGKYFFRRVEAKYQHEANAIFDAEMQSATRCGSARPVEDYLVLLLTTLERNKKNNRNC